MSNYNETLNLYKQLQKNGSEHVDANVSTPTVIGSTVEALNEAVYGAYDGETGDSEIEGQKILNETMKEVESGNLSEANRRRIEDNIKNLKLPAAILEEMINNPLINTKVDGKDDIDEFANRVLKSSAGIQKSSKIIEKLEKKDEKAQLDRMQMAQPNVTFGNNVDYEKISQIVESIVSSKLAEYERRSHMLNESRQANISQPSMKVLQLKENGSFLMLDTDNNIYECKLTYKGKNRKKQ